MRNGDWVTPSKDYAKMHGEHRLEGKYRIIEDEVSVNELWWNGNDSREWGFDNGKGYKYKNVKNNRKSDELVTRDDKGNVIPRQSVSISARQTSVIKRLAHLLHPIALRWLCVMLSLTL